MDIIDFDKQKHTDQLVKLFKEFGNYLMEVDPLKRTVYKPDNAEPYTKCILNKVVKANGTVYVAVKDKKVIGFIMSTVRDMKPSLEDDCIAHRKGRVIELFVTERYRKHGVGKKLIDKMEKFFKEKACDVVNIEVFAPNTNAYQFYKSIGYEDRNIDLMKTL